MWCYMKKVIMIVALAFSFAAFLSSLQATEFYPILSDGKSWLCEAVGEQRDGQAQSERFIVEVARDTVVHNRVCKLVRWRWVDNPGRPERYYVMNEESGRLNWFSGRHFCPVIDLNFDVNDEIVEYSPSMGAYVSDGSSYLVTAVSFKSVNGRMCKELCISTVTQSREIVNCWVESVGCASNYCITPGSNLGTGMSGWHMLECYDNGVCIFKGEDFSYPVSSVDSVEAYGVAADCGPVYDLGGRMVRSVARGQVYIKNRRKFCL